MRNFSDTDEKKDKFFSPAGLLRVLYFLLLPAASFFLMEAYEHNAFLEVRTNAIWLNILLFELIGWGLYFLVGRMQIAAVLLLLFSMVFGLINHYVMVFRSTPFVPWDIFSVGTAASVMGNYDFTPTPAVVFVTLGFLGLMVLSFPVLARGPKIHIMFRVGAFALAAVGLCSFVHLLQQESFQNKAYLYPFLFTPAYMTKVNGMAVTFAMDLAYVAVDKPKGYDAAEAKAVLETYEHKNTGAEPQELPNLIVIMDEAFSDLSVLGNLETTEDEMPFLHKMQKGAENTITGNVQVSVCGGNTANSEFEFLTGNTMAFLPAGSIPYQQYIKSETPSLAGYLKSLGYETYAQHPYMAGGWNRNQVYPLLGFDHMDFLPEYTGAGYVRKYVSDASDMQHIIETFEKKKAGVPLFLFNVTMQNHGGYTDVYPDLSLDVRSGYGSSQLDQYLSLLRLSDQALEQLVSYFSQVDEKTMIVFFGDHQPASGVTSAITDNPLLQGALDKNETLRYQVPYLVWANFDIEEKTKADTSLNYLAAQVLAAAGIPTNSYQNFLLELSSSYPVISAAGETKAAGASEEILNTYRKLQYYQLFEKEKK